MDDKILEILTQMQNSMNEINTRLDRIEQKQLDHDKRLDRIEQKQLDHDKRFDELNDTIKHVDEQASTSLLKLWKTPQR